MTDTATLEALADEILAHRQADYDAKLREQVVAELRADEERQTQEAAAQAEAARHVKVVDASRKRALRAAGVIEDSLEILAGRIAEVLALPLLQEAAPNARSVITNRLGTVLGQSLPDMRAHPDSRQDRPLTEIL